MAIKKKQNVFVRYFVPFGLRQVCDLMMLIGAILVFVGLFTVDGVLLAGFIVYAIASCISIVRCCLVLFNKEINHRDPMYKGSIINVVIMGVLFALAVFGIVWTLVA